MTSATEKPYDLNLGRPVEPERSGGQGLDSNQFAAGDRAILALLTDAAVAASVDLVITFRAPLYEVWSKSGMVRFCRSYAAGGGYRYDVVEQVGGNPIERQDHTALATVEEELAAAARSGSPVGDGTRAFISAAELTYPFAYERIAQLFDSPDAPDLVVHPTCYAAGRQPGQHGCLDVLQSRCPLIISGPGVRVGVATAAARQVDVAPTIAHLLGLPLIDGRDITGRTATERGVAADVYLARQDGRVLTEALAATTDAPPERAYIFLLDGLHSGELMDRLGRDDGSLPNLRRLVAGGTVYRTGSVTNFPSITWPSHNAIGTGAWCGHHDIVNPIYYRRARREVADPQGRQFETEAELSHDVDTLFEAIHIVHGAWAPGSRGRGAMTAAINEPCNRGAVHASLERRLVGDRERLKALTAELLADVSPRWVEEGHEALQREAIVDTRGTAQVIQLFSDPEIPPPAFTFHELVLTDGAGHDYGPHTDGARAALDESDRRIGRVLAALDARGLFASTLFVVTSDHGMAAQNLDVSGDQAKWLVENVVSGIALERFVYLHDLDVQLETDGDAVTLMVRANDADESGVRPAIDGAEAVLDGSGAGEYRALADADGVIRLRDVPGDEVIEVRADGFNPRRFRVDGVEVLPDLRAALYGPRV